MTHQRAIEAIRQRLSKAGIGIDMNVALVLAHEINATLAAEGFVVVPSTLTDVEVNRALGRTDNAMVTPMQAMFRDFYNNIVRTAAQQEQNAPSPLAGGE